MNRQFIDTNTIKYTKRKPTSVVITEVQVKITMATLHVHHIGKNSNNIKYCYRFREAKTLMHYFWMQSVAFILEIKSVSSIRVCTSPRIKNKL